MKIVRIVGNVLVNGLPAEVGMEVLPEDMLDARGGAEVEFENGAVFISISANFGCLIGLQDFEQIPSTSAVQTVEPAIETTPSETVEFTPAVDLPVPSSRPLEDTTL